LSEIQNVVIQRAQNGTVEDDVDAKQFSHRSR
jgi:hypothetical protein